ncbi:class I and II aminotransferase [Escherichia coli]|uniref:Class I and II aminotransferase n=1 Tax=Escherichia coli TaxID=562 RepID=A0A377BUH8_ECOLX|nr:class I and II aminotransferase [Escherichia coli]
MMCEMIKRNDLLRLSETVIKPFYYQRVQETIAIIRRYLPENRCLIHKPEGAIFLWLWFKDLPITTGAALSAPESTRRADGAGAQLLPRAG